jgi:sugar phosphate isomerase/epimerase
MRGPAGPERVDYGRVAKIMREAGYAGYLSVEYEDADDPREAVPAFVETLRQALR